MGQYFKRFKRYGRPSRLSIFSAAITTYFHYQTTKPSTFSWKFLILLQLPRDFAKAQLTLNLNARLSQPLSA
jgi:hypothetical protein